MKTKKTVEAVEIYLPDWCSDNMLTALSASSFTASMIQLGSQYAVVYTNKVRYGDKFVRGFRGIRSC